MYDTASNLLFPHMVEDFRPRTELMVAAIIIRVSKEQQHKRIPGRSETPLSFPSGSVNRPLNVNFALRSAAFFTLTDVHRSKKKKKIPLLPPKDQ